jgi:hypothetical protein
MRRYRNQGIFLPACKISLLYRKQYSACDEPLLQSLALAGRKEPKAKREMTTKREGGIDDDLT